MQLSGMLYGSKILPRVDFPCAEVLPPNSDTLEIQAFIDRFNSILIKPIFKGVVGKKGKAGLVGIASDLANTLEEKKRLWFAKIHQEKFSSQANGVTYEEFVPADIEIYFSLTDSTKHRAPVMTISHLGGVDIEDVSSEKIHQVALDVRIGLYSSLVTDGLSAINAPKEIMSPLAAHLPKLWELFHYHGMTSLELNPIRMKRNGNRKLEPIACDFKCAFDSNDTRWKHLGLSSADFEATQNSFEDEVNLLRTHRGQSDVCVLNENGTILAPTFGGGANSVVTEVLGESGIISSDFGGNPPYEKMRAIASICFKYFLSQTNVLLIIGGKSNNTDILETFKGIADALRAHFNTFGPSPLYIVVGRGGPNVVLGMGYLADTLDALSLPYHMFGFDSALTEVTEYAKRVDEWMCERGRQEIALQLGLNEVIDHAG